MERNAVIVAVVLFVGAAVYLNWNYQESEDTGKTLARRNWSTPDRRPPAGVHRVAGPLGHSPPRRRTHLRLFASARLNRQQARDSALSILQDAAADETADETIKAETAMAIQTLADDTVSEAQIENLVTAKGYADCIAFISDDSVSVVVSAGGAELTDAMWPALLRSSPGDRLHRDQVKIIQAEN